MRAVGLSLFAVTDTGPSKLAKDASSDFCLARAFEFLLAVYEIYAAGL